MHAYRLIDSAKRFIAAWRILVGVWIPKKWDLSLSALSQYTKPRIPPVSPWIDRPSEKESGVKVPPIPPSDTQTEPPVKARTTRRPPSRRLVRHVLRSRVEAVNALASYFDHLARAGRDKKVKASPHLAKMYDGEEEGWRYASEIITFLKKRGAEIPTLGQGPLRDDWALSSEAESI